MDSGVAGDRHLGAWLRFTAACLHANEADLTVVALLCNLADAEPMRLAERLLRKLAPPTPRSGVDRWPAPAGRRATLGRRPAAHHARIRCTF